MKRKILDKIRLIFMIPVLEKWLMGKTQGKMFGQLITRFPPNHYQYPVSSFRSIERNGIRYELDLSDSVDWYIYYGFLEKSRLALYDLIEKGMCVIDVGANVGDVTLHVSKMVGDSGVVHSFEPSSKNFKRLSRNLELNRFENVKLNNVGLGSSSDTFVMKTVSPGNLGMNRIVKTDGSTNEFEKISVRTLDDYVAENMVDKVDLIKIDVEGFELHVLMGSQKLISDFRPLIFMELDDSNLIEQGSSARETVRFLEQNGYQLNNAENGAIVSSDDVFNHCHFDVIAVP